MVTHRKRTFRLNVLCSSILHPSYYYSILDSRCGSSFASLTMLRVEIELWK